MHDTTFWRELTALTVRWLHLHLPSQHVQPLCARQSVETACWKLLV